MFSWGPKTAANVAHMILQPKQLNYFNNMFYNILYSTGRSIKSL